MANVVTRYNLGTFEAPEATWDSQITDTHELSTDIAASGSASCKITLPAALSLPVERWGHAIFLGEFPVGGAGEETEIRLKVLISPFDIAPFMPGNTLFFIAGLTGFTDVQGVTVVKKASELGSGFVELVANFAAGNAYGGPPVTAALLYVVRNMSELLEDRPQLLAAYPGLSSRLNNVSWVGGKNIYIDSFEAEPMAIPAIPTPESGGGLYHRENIFMLSVAGSTFEINEPIGWDKILIHLKLDEELWGYKFEFTDKDITLEFDEACGRTALRDYYKLKGADAKAYLLFGLIDRTVDPYVIETLFEMQFAFDTFEDDAQTTVKMSLERKSFNDLFKNRFDIKVPLNAIKSLDGTNVNGGVGPGGGASGGLGGSLSTVDLWLHPIRVQKAATFGYNKIVNIADAIVWKSNAIEDTILENVPPFKFKCNNQVPDLVEPLAPDGQLIYANLSSGQVVRRISFDEIKVYVTLTFDENTPATAYYSRLVLYKKNFIDGAAVPVNPPVDGEIIEDDLHNHGLFSGTFDVAYVLGSGVILQPGEAVFLKLQVQTHGAPMSGVYRLPDSWAMSVTDNSNGAPTVTKAYKLYEAVTRQLRIILSLNNKLKSSLMARNGIAGFAEDGCAGRFLIFNGKMARGIEDFMNLSARDWFVKLIKPLFCAGLSIERDNNGQEFVRVEKLAYFFADIELMNFQTISDYKKECAANYIYNELTFAFSKMPSNQETNSREEFMSQANYYTPIQQVKNKLEVVCEWILSSLYVYYTQAQRFRDQAPDQSASECNSATKPAFETDNDSFAIQSVVHPDLVNYGPFAVTFDDETKTITITGTWRIPLIAGDNFVVSGSVSNNGTHSVGAIEILTPPVNQIIIHVTGSLTDEVAAAVSFQTPARYMAKVQEDAFTTVTGVAYPEALYNLDHHIKRTFYEWRQVIAAGLQEKDATELIRYIDGKLNNTLRTLADGDYPCAPDGNDPASRSYTDNSDETVASLGSPLWTSNIITFKTPLSWDSINLIRKAFEGRHPEDKNYGYFSWTSPEGLLEKGRARLIKYDAAKEIATFELLEKP
jgi:hypothetical protein